MSSAKERFLQLIPQLSEVQAQAALDAAGTRSLTTSSESPVGNQAMSASGS